VEILGNEELIAIKQDEGEGKALALFRIGIQLACPTITYNVAFPEAYLAGNSSFGPAFMVINTEDESEEIPSDLTNNWTARVRRQYAVRDMWLHKDVGIGVRNWTAVLEAHDVAALVRGMWDQRCLSKESFPVRRHF